VALEFQNGGRLDLCEWKVDGDTTKTDDVLARRGATTCCATAQAVTTIQSGPSAVPLEPCEACARFVSARESAALGI
jgi:hypothetical protein